MIEGAIGSIYPEIQSIAKEDLYAVIESMSQATLHQEVELMLKHITDEYNFIQDHYPSQVNQYLTGNRVGKLAVLGTQMRVLQGILERHPKEPAS